MHLTPAGLPSAIPGIGEDIDKEMQQAPQPGRHSIGDVLKGVTAHRRKGAMAKNGFHIITDLISYNQYKNIKSVKIKNYFLAWNIGAFLPLYSCTVTPLHLCAVVPLRPLYILCIFTQKYNQ